MSLSIFLVFFPSPGLRQRTNNTQGPNNQKTGCKIKATYFISLFFMLSSLNSEFCKKKKKKGKSSEILMVLAFDKQEADKHGANFIFN